MQFDRGEYRRCLAGVKSAKPDGVAVVKAIVSNLEKHKVNKVTKDNRDLLYCRLGKPFRSCMNAQKEKRDFDVLGSSAAHQNAYAACSSHLTDTEKEFYGAVMFDRPLNVSKLSEAQSIRNSGAEYAFEDYLKFYDRYSYRECFMNPAGLSAFPDAEMIMYARFNLDFRLCMGKPVLLNRYSGGLLGSEREETYAKCRDGVYNEKTFKKEGGLSRTEKYLYETQVLGLKIKFKDVK